MIIKEDGRTLTQRWCEEEDMEGKSNTEETHVIPGGISVVWILPLTLFSEQQMVNHQQNVKKSNNLHSSIEAVSVVFGFYQVVEINSARVFSYLISFSRFSLSLQVNEFHSSDCHYLEDMDRSRHCVKLELLERTRQKPHEFIICR